MYQKNENDTPLCGIALEDIDDIGVYVSNICQYLVDIDASNVKPGHLMDGLTTKKVFTDFLKYFVQLALKRLQVHDKLIKNFHFKEFVNEEFIDEDIETICYCLVCPTDRQEFMKDCFIKAGIIEESEAEHRLLFTTRVAATSHCQLSRERHVTRIKNNENYLFCDVDDISVGIAKMHAASTESFSSITAISDSLMQGPINLETEFRDYLTENMTYFNLNPSLISQFVDNFSEKVKYTYNDMRAAETVVISQNDTSGKLIEFTYEDLEKIVFNKCFKSVAEYIINADETDHQYRLYLSGKYRSETYTHLVDKYDGEIQFCAINYKPLLDAISSGAVSSILITPVSSQTPYFNSEQVFTSKKILENPTKNVNRNDAYDFIVGIDFGATFSGCSYVQLKDKRGNTITEKTIKTIKENWYYETQEFFKFKEDFNQYF
ncbi:uncharacterized protein EV154DRAFT_262177 [Mucor mucedo]|uniref:uncharacterized protein n=1 Tax=Mucor mucedo TaxID=29922 RepID=UPI00222070ED|nr:uncharacterized protein EV154DRAFT_262177 [Mucor mucedo]KAI7890072.1 hypothetical protein EV154DRAFT_262177 [Mucor mucedo]